MHGLDAGGPAQESFGPETTEGSLNCEETLKLLPEVLHLIAGTY